MKKVIAIDFDGCLCENKFPNVGTPTWDVINEAKERQQKGCALILWTCRDGKTLVDAVKACESWGLYFDAVNENLPERIEAFGNNPRKIGADEYWDDRAVVKCFSNDVRRGDSVVFIDVDAHYSEPEFYPAVGTMGQVLAATDGAQYVQMGERHDQ